MTATAPRILVVGYHAFDVIVPATGTPEPDSKVAVETIRIGGGGPGATAAVALARLGARVSLLARLTDDLPGRMQRAELETAGVDLAYCPPPGDWESPRAVILVDGDRQQRTIYWARGDLPPLDPGEVEQKWLDGVDLLYTDGHECAAAERLATEARRRNLPVVMDAGSVREGSADLAARCTDVISSEIFAPQLTGRKDPVAALRDLAARGPQRVGMTFGAEGVLTLVDGRGVAVPAFAVPVQDTTGAGDAFHAGYAFALSQGRELIECLEFAAAVAACKCTDWGGRRGLPDRERTEELIRTGTRLQLGERLRACVQN